MSLNPISLQITPDYLLLLQGLSALLFATAVKSTAKHDKLQGWEHLSLFGYFTAISIWITLIPLAIPSAAAAIAVAQPVLSIAASIIALEFARSRLATRTPLCPKIWIHVPILAAIGAATLFSPSAAPQIATSCQAAGLFLAACLLAAPNTDTRSALPPRLRTLLGIALATWSITHLAHLFIHEYVDGRHLLTLANFLATATALRCYVHTHFARMPKQQAKTWLRRRILFASALIIVLLTGKITADALGSSKDSEMRNNALARAQLSAAAVPAAFAQALTWSEADLGHDAYEKLKQLMIAMVATNHDLRFVLLAGLRDHQCYFLTDSEKPTSADYSPPGQLYSEASADYVSAMQSRRPFALGPVTDRWGQWILASAPVGDPALGINLELDIAASDWAARINLTRVPIILITLLISVLLITSFDSHERIRNQVTQLQATEHRTRAIIDTSLDAIVLQDARGLITDWNLQAEQTFGIPRRDALGLPLYTTLLAPDYRTLIEDGIRRFISLGDRSLFENRMEITALRHDGTTFPAELTLSPMHSDDTWMFNLFIHDISAQKDNEAELLKAKENAEAANQAKSEFLAMMSHEIRTPIGGVIGMLTALRKLPLTEQQATCAQIANDNAEVLLEILDHILDTSKIEAGKITVEATPFSLKTEIDRVLALLSGKAREKKLALSTVTAPQIPDALIGDPLRLRQVLTNLLSNAIKFTETGAVMLRVDPAQIASPADHITLCIKISDTGLGMTAETLSRLFQKFEQADASTTRKYGGTGLGLTICKNLVELMQGTIQVESTPGVGTTFTINLPFLIAAPTSLPAPEISPLTNTQPAPPASPPSPAQPSAALRLLCAEDNPTNRLVAQFILEQLGHHVTFVENGQLAVDILQKERFDAVLMDNRMPVMDGFQATRAIRAPASPVLDPQIYIIALTANASSSYKSQCIASGMNDYLTKPIREPALKIALEKAQDSLRQRGLTSAIASVPATLTSAQSAPALTPAIAPVTPAPASSSDGLSEAEIFAMIEDHDTLSSDSSPAVQLSPQARAEITRQYLKETPILLNTMRIAWGLKDAATLGRSGHSMKSSSRYVNANKLSAIGRQIEDLAQAQRFDDVVPLLSQADAEFLATNTRLQNTSLN